MKAAIITNFGAIPQYANFPDPAPGNDNEMIDVKACVLDNFNIVTANGAHYSSNQLFPKFPAIIGNGGVGINQDGKLVAFGNVKPPYGSFAEKAAAGYTMPLPGNIDPAEAAAIMPSVMTSLLPLKYSAKLQKGETVVVNGATGVSGRIAVQVAKMLGAGKIIATGRNEGSLKLMATLGADNVIDLKQEDQAVAKAFIKAGGKKGFDVVIDFLWGRPAEILMNTLIPKEAGFARNRTRYIQIGEKAGSHISLPASALRTSGLELMGIGKILPDILNKEMEQVMLQIRDKQFYMEIEKIPLEDISKAWQRTEMYGKRIVMIP